MGPWRPPIRPAWPISSRNRMSILVELWAFIRHRKKFWLLPILLTLALVGGLLILAQSSAIAPFLYTPF